MSNRSTTNFTDKRISIWIEKYDDRARTYRDQRSESKRFWLALMGLIETYTILILENK